MNQHHATCVVITDKGVLIRGPSGSGKSDLALRLIEAGARLVADDYVELSARDGEVWATAPDTIKNKMEVRGVGVISRPAVDQARLEVVLDLSESTAIDRLPDAKFSVLEGIAIRTYSIYPFEASAIAKIKVILDCL